MIAAVETVADQDPAVLVRLRDVSKRFGAVEAVRPLDLDIYAGDFFAILGPSGCGKTTLLRIIGGFIAPTSGTVEIDGAEVTKLGPEHRPTNMVFQGYGLFPHMTVRQNIGYGLRIAKKPKDEIESRVAEIIALVRLEELAERGTHELSGGQQQRVALARALVMRPKVLLLDEPLGALDLKLRQVMQEELRQIHYRIGGTFVFVTHDQGEALGLANRIAVMEDGVFVQEGGPEEVYGQPKTRFVSTFVGEANILTGRRQNGAVRLDAGPTFADGGADSPVIAVIRPEALTIGATSGGGCEFVVDGALEDIVFLGTHVKLIIALDAGERIIAHSSDLKLRDRLAVGDRISVGWSLDEQSVVEDR